MIMWAEVEHSGGHLLVTLRGEQPALGWLHRLLAREFPSHRDAQRRTGGRWRIHGRHGDRLYRVLAAHGVRLEVPPVRGARATMSRSICST
jgi:hypothetical protein